MADGQAPAVAAAFPNPPPYFKYFTKENLTRLEEIEKSQSVSENAPKAAIYKSVLPKELRYLIPPSPPADGKYQSFGIHHDLNQPDISLEAAGITQIYPSSPSSTDPTPKLLALTRAIILNFLELLGIMSNNPEEGTEKIEDLQTLFYNTHDLINQYRPHQARESLILMMEEQLDRSRSEIAAVQDEREKLRDLLKSIEEAGEKHRKQADGSRQAESKTVELRDLDHPVSKRQELQRTQWELLDAEIG